MRSGIFDWATFIERCPMISKSLPNSLLRAIGAVAAEWSYVEFRVRTLLADLAEAEVPYGTILTAHMTMNVQLDALVACADARTVRDGRRASRGYLTNKDADVLRALVTRVEQLRGQRNDAVHALWIPGKRKRTQSHLKLTARRVFKTSEIKRTVKEVEKLALDIAELEHDLYAFQDGFEELRRSRD
jgi:hypothetical protein